MADLQERVAAKLESAARVRDLQAKRAELDARRLALAEEIAAIDAEIAAANADLINPDTIDLLQQLLASANTP